MLCLRGSLRSIQRWSTVPWWVGVSSSPCKLVRWGKNWPLGGGPMSAAVGPLPSLPPAPSGGELGPAAGGQAPGPGGLPGCRAGRNGPTDGLDCGGRGVPEPAGAGASSGGRPATAGAQLSAQGNLAADCGTPPPPLSPPLNWRTHRPHGVAWRAGQPVPLCLLCSRHVRWLSRRACGRQLFWHRRGLQQGLQVLVQGPPS